MKKKILITSLIIALACSFVPNSVSQAANSPSVTIEQNIEQTNEESENETISTQIPIQIIEDYYVPLEESIQSINPMSKAPQTSDESHLYLYVLVGLFCLLIFCSSVAKIKRQ